MRYVTLKHLKDEEKKINFSYRVMLTTIMESPIGGQGGLPVGEMRRAIRVLEKLEKLTDSATGAPVLALEDAEWEIVHARVQAWPWPGVHAVYIGFCDAVEHAPTERQAERKAKP